MKQLLYHSITFKLFKTVLLIKIVISDGEPFNICIPLFKTVRDLGTCRLLKL